MGNSAKKAVSEKNDLDDIQQQIEIQRSLENEFNQAQQIEVLEGKDPLMENMQQRMQDQYQKYNEQKQQVKDKFNNLDLATSSLKDTVTMLKNSIYKVEDDIKSLNDHFSAQYHLIINDVEGQQKSIDMLNLDISTIKHKLPLIENNLTNKINDATSSCHQNFNKLEKDYKSDLKQIQSGNKTDYFYLDKLDKKQMSLNKENDDQYETNYNYSYQKCKMSRIRNNSCAKSNYSECDDERSNCSKVLADFTNNNICKKRKLNDEYASIIMLQSNEKNQSNKKNNYLI